MSLEVHCSVSECNTAPDPHAAFEAAHGSPDPGERGTRFVADEVLPGDGEMETSWRSKKKVFSLRSPLWCAAKGAASASIIQGVARPRCCWGPGGGSGGGRGAATAVLAGVGMAAAGVVAADVAAVVRLVAAEARLAVAA